ncbi:3-hydroxyacyl-CoA dehydrogenase NAD-binding domain-containing protein [Limibaculum sp. FT325]|uniref:3-hydroxyacyl-CoA dehydrogenase NAD-binding domain-containing protein n=1 Tax=Thermohalobaculum sediminis TaxID=2939436 RepID=UPI0020BDF86B|nr:3-hydroxyacyl-CoA dehydrogenase NAD-binding domain-containing protein [Limibaculum sediminis]MCL5777722.1 3-hydroxyacyl-CoA dehydrogenase NAD-binding domain-containing protein [Limibaculum sediminis]
MSEIFRLSVDDGIATITWDLPGASMNVLNEQGIRELDAHVDSAITDPSVKGVIITSAKPDFAGGMDLNVLAKMKAEAAATGGDPAARIFGFVMQLHGVLRKIERAGADPKTNKGGKPFVWACPGTSMGIGTEIGLACHRRIAADAPRAKIGLPEILVGLFPGAGGTTRLVRMLGLMGASEFLLQGKTPAPKRAKAGGLIDDVVEPQDLMKAARAWLRDATESEAVKPWDRKGFKIPGGAPYTVEGFQMFLGAAAMTHGKTQGVYLAARAMLSAVYEGALVPFDTAIRIEARWFTHVLMNPSSEAMIRSLFLSKQALEKGAARPADLPDMKVQRLGVLGAGMMGAGIAHVAAEAGIDVVLIDRDQASADKGRDGVAAILDAAVKQKRIDEARRDEILDRILPTPDYSKLAKCDLVVEAVFEDPGLKAKVTKMAENVLGPDAIFATNTSTLPISDLARASARPEHYIGLHFFSPVHKMNLVEIIKGRETGPEAIAKALDFVRQIRKTPIVVNDARFFYANRCILPYVNEGVRMVAEGVEPALIENAARQMGMPVGPLQLSDEVSLELGLKIAQATKAALGEAYPKSPADEVLRAMVEDKGRLGRKNGKGFYAYDERGKRIGLWPGLAELWPHAAARPALEEVQNRLMMAQALEAVRALEDGVLTDIREGDVGAILGWGFAPWSGGPFGWLDMLGAAHAVGICERLAARHGPRFAPPKTLRKMAEAGGRFYPSPSGRRAA